MVNFAASSTDFELIGSLNEHERQILALLAEHHSNQEIADTLFLSLNTVKWYARRIYEKLGVSNRRDAAQRAMQLGVLETPLSSAGNVPNNLPSPLTSFVGRQAELTALHDMLLNPGCRLLTITGPGGIGKTRLALEVAGQLAKENHEIFQDGVFWVPLADLVDTNSLVSGVADAVGFRFFKTRKPLGRQLAEFFRSQKYAVGAGQFRAPAR